MWVLATTATRCTAPWIWILLSHAPRRSYTADTAFALPCTRVPLHGGSRFCPSKHHDATAPPISLLPYHSRLWSCSDDLAFPSLAPRCTCIEEPTFSPSSPQCTYIADQVFSVFCFSVKLHRRSGFLSTCTAARDLKISICGSKARGAVCLTCGAEIGCTAAPNFRIPVQAQNYHTVH